MQNNQLRSELGVGGRASMRGRRARGASMVLLLALAAGVAHAQTKGEIKGGFEVDEIAAPEPRPINVIYVSAATGKDDEGYGLSIAKPLASIEGGLEAARLDGMDTLIYVDHGDYSQAAGAWSATDRVIMIGVNFAEQFGGTLCAGGCAEGRVRVTIDGEIPHDTLKGGGYGLAIEGPLHIVGFDFTHAYTPLLFSGASEGGAVLEDSVVTGFKGGPTVAVTDGAVELRRARIRANAGVGVLVGDNGRLTLTASLIDARGSGSAAIVVNGAGKGLTKAYANVHRSVIMGGSPALEGRAGRIFLTSSIVSEPDGASIDIVGSDVEDVEIIGNSFFNGGQATITNATRLVLANNDMRGMEVSVTDEACDKLANDPMLSNVNDNLFYLSGLGKTSLYNKGPTELTVVPTMQDNAKGVSLDFDALASDPLFIAGAPRAENTTPDLRLADNYPEPVDPLRWLSTVSNWRQDILGNTRSDTRAAIGAFASSSGTGDAHRYTPTPTTQFGAGWESQSLIQNTTRLNVRLEDSKTGPTNIPAYGPADVQEIRLPTFAGSSPVLYFDLWISWAGLTPGPAVLTVAGDTTVLARETVLTTPAKTPPERHWTLPFWPSHTHAIDERIALSVGFSPAFAGSGPTSAPSGSLSLISGLQFLSIYDLENRVLGFERVRIPVGKLSGDGLIRINVAGPIASWGMSNVRVLNSDAKGTENEWSHRPRFEEVGRFTGLSEVQTATGATASAMAVADVNADGVLDLVQTGTPEDTTDRMVLSFGSPKLYEGSENLNFDRRFTSNVPGRWLLPISVRPTGPIGLWNARSDGRVAGLFGAMNTDTKSFSFNTLSTGTVANVSSALVTDWNRDGTPDIVSMGTTENILLMGQMNASTKTDPDLSGFTRGMGFLPSNSADVGTTTALLAGDFNNDRFPELLTDLGGGRMYNSRGLASGFIDRGVRAQPSLAGDRSVIAAADFNNDGWLDVLTSGEPTVASSGLRLWTNPANNSASFSNTSAARGLGGSQLGGLFAAAWGDYDNDGDVDLVAFHGPTRDKATLTVFANSGSPSYNFSPLETGAETVMNAGNIVLADMNNDRWLDIVTSSSGGGQASRLFLNRMAENPAWAGRGSLFVRMQGRGAGGIDPVGYHTTIELWDKAGKERLARRDVAANPGEPPIVHFGGLDMGQTYLVRAYGFDAGISREYVLESEVVPIDTAVTFDGNHLHAHAMIEERRLRPMLRVEGWKPTTAEGAEFEVTKPTNTITGVDPAKQDKK